MIDIDCLVFAPILLCAPGQSSFALLCRRNTLHNFDCSGGKPNVENEKRSPFSSSGSDDGGVIFSAVGVVGFPLRDVYEKRPDRIAGDVFYNDFVGNEVVGRAGAVLVWPDNRGCCSNGVSDHADMKIQISVSLVKVAMPYTRSM
jgi:hypothetical protein